MNESIAPIAPVESAAPDYKDRSVGLMIFGILTLLLGCLCGLFVPLMLFGQMAAARLHPPSANTAAMLPAIVIYGGLAVALIWLGIGSIQARRWARALLLIFSWVWLVAGVVMLIVMSFVMPKVFANMATAAPANQPMPPAAAMHAVMVFMLLFSGVFFVVVPAFWVFFYNSRHVKATCQARDGVTRWTDACPLPVLGLCLWLLFSVPMLLLMPLSAHGVVPFFGMFLSGAPGSLICLLFAAVWAYAAWLIYHLKSEGWWLILLVMVLSMVSALATFAHHDMLEMYRLMGYPKAQIDQMQKTGLMTGNSITWLMTLSVVPVLGYLLFVKRYFRGKA